MPSNETANYVANPDWDTERKVQSRADTIIAPYRRYFGQSLPSDKQFWSMCGAHYKIEAGHVVGARGELSQLLDSGIIKAEQYIGVDHDETVIRHNNGVYPLNSWLCGDFKDVMGKMAIDGKYRPGIVNYDGVRMPKFGAPYLKKLMQFLDNNAPNDLMLVGNFVLKLPYRKANSLHGMAVVDELLRIYSPPDHWHLLPFYYSYKGGSTRRSHTDMGSFVFIKRGQTLERTKGRRLDDLEAM